MHGSSRVTTRSGLSSLVPPWYTPSWLASLRGTRRDRRQRSLWEAAWGRVALFRMFREACPRVGGVGVGVGVSVGVGVGSSSGGWGEGRGGELCGSEGCQRGRAAGSRAAEGDGEGAIEAIKHTSEPWYWRRRSAAEIRSTRCWDRQSVGLLMRPVPTGMAQKVEQMVLSGSGTVECSSGALTPEYWRRGRVSMWYRSNWGEKTRRRQKKTTTKAQCKKRHDEADNGLDAGASTSSALEKRYRWGCPESPEWASSWLVVGLVQELSGAVRVGDRSTTGRQRQVELQVDGTSSL